MLRITHLSSLNGIKGENIVLTISVGLLLVLGFLYIRFAYYVFTVWENDIAEKRVSRRDQYSPSNKLPPDIKSFESNKQRTQDNAKLHENFDNCELLNEFVGKDGMKKRTNDLFRERAKRSNSLTPGAVVKARTTIKTSLDDVGQAEELNMDHIFLSYIQFLWGFTFVGPFSYLLWWKGTKWLSIRTRLVKLGILKVKPCDLAEVVGKLCLEQSQAIHFYAKTKPTSKLGNIAGFFFANFPYVNGDCEYQIADLLAVDIDLDTKKWVKAKLDDRMLNVSETLTLLWFNGVCAQHVKLHSMANWGVNVDKSVAGVEPFFHRNSIVTTMYNYFGFSRFSSYFETWEKQGLLSVGWDPDAWVQCVKHGIRDNIWQHSQIEQLVKYSRFVNFIVKVREIFLKEFASHKKSFPGVHGEAMFIGTIMHSLDHCFLDWNLEDPLWLDVDHKEFGKMAEIGRIVKAGFVSDVSGLYFNKRFKGSNHPFYKSVYKKAARVDKFLADNMDTCIIK